MMTTTLVQQSSQALRQLRPTIAYYSTQLPPLLHS